MNIVITGVSKGIGFELLRIALENHHKVIGVYRSTIKGKVNSLPHQEHLILLKGDVTDEQTHRELQAAAQGLNHIDLVISNAGALFEGESKKDFLASFEVNTIAPFMLAKALLPFLQKAKAPKLVQITSRMGSISDNKSGGYYAYRTSKAALNMINMSLAKDHPEVTCLVIHPGWVKTDMGGPQAPLLPEESARGIWKVIEGAKLKDTGRFFDYSGEPIGW